MATDTSARLMTTEELLALPENGMDRELVAGELRERPMTMRNRHHSEVEASIAMVLGVCLRTRPQPRGKVVSGEAGFRLARDPDTSVGIDVAYVSAEVTSRSPDTPFFEGAPVLAVEVLSPSDRTEDIDEKVNLYLNLGVAVVWVVHPGFRTITVYRPNTEPELFNVTQEISAEPHLPGFRVAVASLFDA